MENEKPLQAQKMMDDFCLRTGLSGKQGDITRRYLWTDAFAVQSLFGLAHICKENSYQDTAIALIDTVHAVLGKFHPKDNRNGWISGLNEEEGKKHPTIGGLRIGKKMLERQEDEPINERLEWERDGQYFHYITRWVSALMKAQQLTDNPQYAVWAAELLQAGKKFLHTRNDRLRIYWKMSVDLSRPLIPTMGAHDPLEGWICAEIVKNSGKKAELADFTRDMEEICVGRDWFTTDDLGLGGLLLNYIRISDLAREKQVPDAMKPDRLLANCLEGLEVYSGNYDKARPANHRLAFRECGLSLGLRALSGSVGRSKSSSDLFDQLLSYLPLADEIEDFWINRQNRQSRTWTDHLDINEVSLASSMVAKYRPQAY